MGNSENDNSEKEIAGFAQKKKSSKKQKKEAKK